MAAYAALVSLMNTMEQIQNHPLYCTLLERKQIESLLEKASFFQDFIEGYSSGNSEEAEVLESEVASAAHAAEDVIEFEVVDRILSASIDHWRSSSFFLDLEKVIQEMDSLKEKVMKVKEEMGFRYLQPVYSKPATASRHLATGMNTMVGFDDELIHLMDELTGQRSSRKIIPIVGMAGIGKTTLARNVYENLVIVQHFDIRCWVTVSQEFSVKEILLELLSCRNKENNEMSQKTEDHLGELLHKSLFSRRYLIILDDIWSIEPWDKIKFFIPDNNNRSRIVVTTRQSNVAVNFDSSFLSMKFLDEDKSWELLCGKAFSKECCPPELEEIGKKIAKKCKGLPLAVVVIGGLLGKSPRTQECWENIAKDITSVLNSGEDEHCLNILSLSYTHLIAHLKPCFLYMGTFPEDYEIHVSRLIKLWVAEGFLRPNKLQSLEEIAEDYLRDLVARNLILVRKWGLNGKIKSCGIHDLLREVCLRIGEKEKFFCVMRVREFPQIIDMERRIVFHGCIRDEYNSRAFLDLQSVSLARSLICDGGWVPFKFALLRVLNVVDSYSLDAIFKQVNLRYIVYKPTWTSISLLSPELPSSISLLWNVQTIIMKGCIHRFVAPLEIWKMPQLRHLEFSEICLPDPPSDQDDFVLENLQTLSKVVNFNCSEEVRKRIPNIKKLHIYYDDFSKGCKATSYYSFHNIGDLHKLESLNCYFSKSPNRDDLLQSLIFPSSLKKLSLTYCHLHWEDLTIIGSLPHLEVLKLERDSFIGPGWNPVEGEFLRLKFLKIHCPDLIYWNAESTHFPVLENLVLAHLLDLDEIPLDIGEIPTLQVIRLDCCSLSAAISAMKILEEQENQGNEGLQVRVQFLEKAELEIFKETVELTSSNFHIVEPAYDYLTQERSAYRGPIINIEI